MAEPDSQNLTQLATQRVVDPRRQGRNNSGLQEQDISDVICILHPASRAAYDIVLVTAERNPQHILQNTGFEADSQYDDPTSATEMDTLVVPSFQTQAPKDIALRFSARVQDPAVGFCFGRNPMKCDINLDPKDGQKRVSNTHFRIFVNSSSVLMLEDTSTNGTIVDDTPLGSKRSTNNQKRRMLQTSSIIQILSPNADDEIKFVVRIPSRDGHFDAYRSKFQKYMELVAVAEQRREAATGNKLIPEGAARGMLAGPLTGPPNPKHIPPPEPLATSHHGMKWDGDGIYRCIGILGKGAFAIVYQVAKSDTGEVFAAKELEKKRFVKNGHMDTKLDNEMQIMKGLRHPNIVQYIDYHETSQHLYIIMEYVPYGDLQGYMHAHGTLPESLARDMTRQVFDALSYLHNKNITHRDIKPDNILICSEEPFTVKLTDFGLSKVVKNNETFLKTFCGTLLYCAPEVFPHYDNYVAGKRLKRRRDARSKNRSYSQLVDIWSYAAVLWFVLCGKPPFDGVMDANGRAMFTKIMETSLNTKALSDKGVSEPAIDMLVRMLQTDPASRPSEADLLKHPWLTGGIAIAQGGERTGQYISLMSAIIEQDEELDASQLSIYDNDESTTRQNDNLIGSDENSQPELKRVKAENLYEAPALQRHTPLLLGLKDIPKREGSGDGPAEQTRRQTQAPMLFGEITASAALKSSGTLGNLPAASPGQAERGRNNDIPMESSSDGSGLDEDQMSDLAEKYSYTAAAPTNAGKVQSAAPSLYGAESMVRDLKMTSPGDHHIARHSHTRQEQHHSDIRPEASVVSQETPKPKVFKRQINIPLSASFFYDPFGDAALSGEAQRSSDGQFKVEEPSNGFAAFGTTALPETAAPSFRSDLLHNHTAGSEDRPQQVSSATVPQASQANLTDNPTDSSITLGHLGTTNDSFAAVSIDLRSRVTTWGRNPHNTHVFKDINDVRVPKVAFEIWFYAASLGSLSKQAQRGTSTDSDGKDSKGGSSSSSVSYANTTFSAQELSQCEDLQAIIRTQSRGGIWVNGTHLPFMDNLGRRCYGFLQNRDEVLVSAAKDGNTTNLLKFVATFDYGLARLPRSHDTAFTVLASDH